ncbi:13197_t:CDS:2, partial [Cetraspora pellucida]
KEIGISDENEKGDKEAGIELDSSTEKNKKKALIHNQKLAYTDEENKKSSGIVTEIGSLVNVSQSISDNISDSPTLLTLKRQDLLRNFYKKEDFLEGIDINTLLGLSDMGDD